MALRISTVADSISNLSVANLTIRDIDQSKVNPEKRLSVLVPNDEYITDVVAERESTGGALALMTMSYTLNYRLLYKPMGTGRSMTLEQFSGLVSMIGLIWDAFLAIGVIAGCEDMMISNISSFGPIEAPNGDPWWGCILGFQVKEFVR